MKDEKQLENKAKTAKGKKRETKAVEEQQPILSVEAGEGQESAQEGQQGAGTVKVRVRPFRGVGGIGGPGTVAEVPEALAQSLEKDGFVDILKEDE